ncbi:MAG: recombination-associated protein RdgC [Porticoccaceae bacterium]
MLFKNLLVYRFTKPFTQTPEEFAELLAAKIFRPCGKQEQTSLGWVPPIGQDDSPLVHAANGRMMVCLQRQEKLLPGAIVNEVLAEKIAEMEAREGRKPGKQERITLKEEIVFELLPRAFSRTRKLYAYIDLALGLLIVDSASHKSAEELISELRTVLGSLPVASMKTHHPIPPTLTTWLAEGQLPEDFTLGGECELRDTDDEGGVIRCKNQDLFSDEIRSHLASGMYVSKMALCWSGGIDCIIDENFSLKRLRFGDLIDDKLGEVDAESAGEQFDIDFTIMAGEFANFIPVLVKAFGGGNDAETD